MKILNTLGLVLLISIPCRGLPSLINSVAIDGKELEFLGLRDSVGKVVQGIASAMIEHKLPGQVVDFGYGDINGVNDTTLKGLAELLQLLTKLEVLSFSHNRISDTGLQEQCLDCRQIAILQHSLW